MGAVTGGMSIMNYMENDGQDHLLVHYKTVDDLSDERYRKIFQDLKEEGILINSYYDDAEWVLKENEGRKFYVSFDMDGGAVWNDRLKHFALLKLDAQKADVHSTSVNIKRVMKELPVTDYLNADLIPAYREKIGRYDRSRRMYLSALGEFLVFIGGENAEEYYNVISGVPQICSVKSRELPCYQSILLFDHVINDFIQRTNTEEKARYYPLLIWWKISSVIPLRPGEVYQLPRNCTHEKNGKYYIHIERVKNKYKRKQYSSPVVKDFEIREDVCSLISDYIDYTSQFTDAEETDYLFSIQILRKTAGLKPKDEDVERLTHITMQTIYNHFKKEVIEQEYGYHVVPLGQKQDENDIEEVKMGDVRHLAIINLMMMGYNPLYIMELAGHRKLNTQMGYYNHVDTFATAKSHVLKEMIKKAGSSPDFSKFGSGDFVMQKNLLGAFYYGLPLVFDGKGRCRSKNFPYECVYTECIFCPHFIPDRNLSSEYYDALKEENEKDLEALQMELKLLMAGSIDNRRFEKVGKKIGVTLNQKILIHAYQHLQEEKE